jgi:cellobiose-specific phosphotransferase system component IIA
MISIMAGQNRCSALEAISDAKNGDHAPDT